ncbi:Imm5 family immunity protein [Paenibacillus sp. p3-SID1389]|uniref:putative immunity protein n=1 Tax=Paenibacillus sp. FSL K6-2441 TaxID=2954679 RepID=UPI0037EF96BE|nr:Imm5 family immunity protein [Paenibacillus sp. p3-SID1389]
MESRKFVDVKIKRAIADQAEQMDQRTLALWAAECAERVLPCFEAARPKDLRPRQAIEAARAWVRGEVSMAAARAAAVAAHNAAHDAGHASAGAAARAAGHAAATAHVAGHAAHSATYAAKAIAYAADNAEAAKARAEQERQWQLRRLLELGT